MAEHTQTSEPEPSDSLKGFGEVVRGFRERAGLTRDQLAPAVCCSKHTITSIETGRRFPPPHFAERADQALDAGGILVRAARHLSRNPGLATWFRMWAKLEEEAVSLCTYECRVIPGLLQTAAYARASTMNVPPPKSDEQVTAQVLARLERQRLLNDKPNTAYSFIIEQALIERHVGGLEVTGELIDLLLVRAQLTNVELQIMPLHQPRHAGSDGPVQLLETPEHQWLGYSEGQRSGLLIPEPKEVSILFQRYAKLRSQALTPEDSVSLLEQTRGAL